jgi:4-diphosphocytidyl-2-C-methyl-D-erythritol kinase
MSSHLPNTLGAEAPAKVNLFLRVVGRRADGYHELQSLVAPIDLSDHVQIHADASSEFRTLALSLEVIGEPGVVAGVPMDESNLVLRAARALAETQAIRGFADITLTKRVPAAAGLGGGSADAAATLRILNDLWEIGLDEEGLRSVGLAVGSDVPALLVSGPALVGGRGERLEALSIPELDLALVTFPFGIRTADAFRWWDEDGATSGPDPEPIVTAFTKGTPAAGAPPLYNDLEDVVTRRHPEIGEARWKLLEAGAAAVVMSGSGPTLVALLTPDRSFVGPDDLHVRAVRTLKGA